MIHRNFSDIYAFKHGISTKKMCDLYNAERVLWGHECQKIREILCEIFLTV